MADFGRLVDAPRSVAIHDALLNDTALLVFGTILGVLLSTEARFERVAPGSDVEI